MTTEVHQSPKYAVALLVTFCDECGQRSRCVEFLTLKDGQKTTLHLCAPHFMDLYQKTLAAYKTRE